jgi:hypothetical protein
MTLIITRTAEEFVYATLDHGFPCLDTVLRNSEIFACQQNFLFLNNWSNKVASKTQIADFII